MGTKLGAGMIVAFEGIDGAGKSTQIKLLLESLRELGIPAVMNRFPCKRLAMDTSSP